MALAMAGPAFGTLGLGLILTKDRDGARWLGAGILFLVGVALVVLLDPLPFLLLNVELFSFLGAAGLGYLVMAAVQVRATLRRLQTQPLRTNRPLALAVNAAVPGTFLLWHKPMHPAKAVLVFFGALAAGAVLFQAMLLLGGHELFRWPLAILWLAAWLFLVFLSFQEEAATTS